MRHTVRAGQAGQLDAQALSITAHTAASSGMGEKLGVLFEFLARAAEQRMSDFNVQGIANTAWAFATVRSSDAQLFAALARASEVCMDDLNAQGLANTAWAFATAGQSDE